jgi:hypothetical protein
MQDDTSATQPCGDIAQRGWYRFTHAADLGSGGIEASDLHDCAGRSRR